MKKRFTSTLQKVRGAYLASRTLDLKLRDQALTHIAQRLDNEREALLDANRKDLKAVAKTSSKKINPAFVDRLTLNEKRIDVMADGLRQIAALPQPLNEVITKTLPNGLVLKKQRSPLGVIFMIFESRPNVALEAFALAFKSGNGIILKGGKESRHTVGVIYQLIQDELQRVGFPKDLMWGITQTDREISKSLLQEKKYIDVVVPRGGEGLIDFVVKTSRIPIIKNDRGLCHAYVHEDADLNMALDIVVNAKTQRPGVCNSLETVLVHERVAEGFIRHLYARMESFNVRWHGDKTVVKILKGKANVKLATAKNFDTEYLDMEINCAVVKTFDEALKHIETYGSRHSESIITHSEEFARRFQNEVDAAAVYWNASTRFTDGYEFGLGGELGISTQKLHVRGPVGLQELTSFRWVIDGTGQIRE